MTTHETLTEALTDCCSLKPSEADLVSREMHRRGYPVGTGKPENMFRRFTHEAGTHAEESSMQEGWFSDCPRDDKGRCMKGTAEGKGRTLAKDAGRALGKAAMAGLPIAALDLALGASPVQAGKALGQQTALQLAQAGLEHLAARKKKGALKSLGQKGAQLLPLANLGLAMRSLTQKSEPMPLKPRQKSRQFYRPQSGNTILDDVIANTPPRR